MKIKEQLAQYKKENKYVVLTRKVSIDQKEKSRGYIVALSDDFVVLQESDEFKMLGFNILPLAQVVKIRHNKFDRYYDQIMEWEKEKPKIGIRTELDLTSWRSIFKAFKKKKQYVIIECEDSYIASFDIGPIKKVKDTFVYIHNFDARGFLDEDISIIDFADISKVVFDDRYIDIFSKYTRKRKKKDSKK